MSADLMVFDKSKAPTDPIEFLKWYYTKSTWQSDRDYLDTKGPSQPLVDFFLEIIKEYPSMNGPYAPDMEQIDNDPELESRLTDYTIDDDLIYMGFAWSVADEACDLVEELAYKHGLGYYDMINIHLDHDSVIKTPQISRDELNKRENKKNVGFFSKLFVMLYNKT